MSETQDRPRSALEPVSPGTNRRTAGFRRRLFASSITPEGPRHHLDSLAGPWRRLFVVSGEPGTGRSSVMNAITEAAAARGLSVELFHCAFDPNDVDHVIIPALDTAIVSSVPPHNYVPDSTPSGAGSRAGSGAGSEDGSSPSPKPCSVAIGARETSPSPRFIDLNVALGTGRTSWPSSSARATSAPFSTTPVWSTPATPLPATSTRATSTPATSVPASHRSGAEPYPVTTARHTFWQLFRPAIAALSDAKAAHMAIEACYVPHMDFDGLERLRKQILDRILEFRAAAK